VDEFPEVAANMEQLCRGIYETVNYMRYHNSPEMVTSKVQQSRKSPPSVTSEEQL